VSEEEGSRHTILPSSLLLNEDSGGMRRLRYGSERLKDLGDDMACCLSPGRLEWCTSSAPTMSR
jgi:hypothetical protein